MAFTDLNGYMDTAEDMIKYIIRYVMEQCPQEMDFFNQFVDKGLRERLEHVASSDFGRVSYTEAAYNFAMLIVLFAAQTGFNALSA